MIWFQASMLLITSHMSNQEVIDHFEDVLDKGMCVVWTTDDCSINFCGGER